MPGAAQDAGGAAGGANLVRLTATVVTRDTLRFTPAGIPLIDLTLRHESTLIEAQLPRLVQATVDAVVLGELAREMDRLKVGQVITVTGFLANRSRRSTRVVLHVNEFESD